EVEVVAGGAEAGLADRVAEGVQGHRGSRGWGACAGMGFTQSAGAGLDRPVAPLNLQQQPREGPRGAVDGLAAGVAGPLDRLGPVRAGDPGEPGAVVAEVPAQQPSAPAVIVAEATGAAVVLPTL